MRGVFVLPDRYFSIGELLSVSLYISVADGCWVFALARVSQGVFPLWPARAQVLSGSPRSTAALAGVVLAVPPVTWTSVCSSVLVCANLECSPWCPFPVSTRGGEWASRAASQLLSAPGSIQQRAGNGSDCCPWSPSMCCLLLGLATKTALNESQRQQVRFQGKCLALRPDAITL